MSISILAGEKGTNHSWIWLINFSDFTPEKIRDCTEIYKVVTLQDSLKFFKAPLG